MDVEVMFAPCSRVWTCELCVCVYICVCVRTGVGCVWSVVCYVKYRWRREEEETRQMYDMVERIIGKEHHTTARPSESIFSQSRSDVTV